MRRALLTATLALGVAALALAPAAEAGPFYFFGKLGSTDTSVERRRGLLERHRRRRQLSRASASGSRSGATWRSRPSTTTWARCRASAPPARSRDPPACPGLPVEADSSAISVTVLPHLLLTRRIQLYAKLGVVSWDTDVSVVGDLAGIFLEKRSDEELRLRRRPASGDLPAPSTAFAEYERIADSFDTVAIGATWGF